MKKHIQQSDKQVQKILDNFVEQTEQIDNHKTVQNRTLSNYDLDKTLFIYCRVSSQIQSEGTSLETQIIDGENLSEKLGFDKIIYNEGSKSSNHEEIHKRQKLFELYDLIKKQKVKHLYVFDLSRLSRTSTISHMIQIQLYKNNVKLYTSKGEYDFENSEDKLMFTIISSFNQYENDIRRTKSILGKIHKLQNNKWVGGTINFGFDVRDSKIVENKDESKHVRKMFKMYDENYSTKEIQSYLIREGVKTKKNNSVFSTESINNILKNEIYIGRRTTIIDSTEINTTNISLVKYDVFNRVRKRIVDSLSRRNQNNKTTNFYLLRHLLYCNKCKNIMCGTMKKRNGIISENFYYCSQSMYRFKRTKKSMNEDKCTLKKSVNIQQTDKVVWETICDLFENSHLLKQSIKDETLLIKSENTKSIGYEVRKLRRKISDIDTVINSLNENIYKIESDFYTIKITKERMMKLITDIEIEIDKRRKEQDKIITQIQVLTNEKTWINWIKKYKDKTDYLRSITDKRKQLKHINEFVERIYVDYDEDSKEHQLDIRLKLKLFNDKLIYKDVNNKKQGYKVIEGNNQKTLNFKREKMSKKKGII